MNVVSSLVPVPVSGTPSGSTRTAYFFSCTTNCTEYSGVQYVPTRPKTDETRD